MDEPVRIPVTDILDLHSIPPRDVKPVVEEYLNEALRLGFTALRIIHGRGVGVQREIVRSALARTAFVRSFGDAPPEAGGWGATLITLEATLGATPDASDSPTGESHEPLLRAAQKF
jgi:DNA-nicking Smr family endonuclease